jgi:hypothetical protein
MLDRAAEIDETSLNRQIVARLERSFDRWASLNVDDIEAKLRKVLGWQIHHVALLMQTPLDQQSRDTLLRDMQQQMAELHAALNGLALAPQNEKEDDK